MKAAIIAVIIMGAKMMFDLVVKNGRIVTSDQIFSANVGVKGETIAAIFAPGLPF